VLLGVMVLAAAGFYFFLLREQLSWDAVRENLASWKQQADDNLALVVAVFCAVYLAVVALSLPVALVLSLIAGALFGRWLGTAVVSASSTAGATLAFLSSRYLLRDWVHRRFAGLLGPIERGVERDGAFYLLTLRLIPAVPFWLINLGMGLTPMRATTFAAVSWAGMLLGTFLFVNVGAELGENLTQESFAERVPWGLLTSLALLGVVPLLLRLVLRRLRPLDS
jgi:uncharacterized membrane protein YdjX (TVP38/TMEM64 family)